MKVLQVKIEARINRLTNHIKEVETDFTTDFQFICTVESTRSQIGWLRNYEMCVVRNVNKYRVTDLKFASLRRTACARACIITAYLRDEEEGEKNGNVLHESSYSAYRH